MAQHVLADLTAPLLDIWVPGVPRPAGSKIPRPITLKDGSRRLVAVDASGEKGKLWRASLQFIASRAWKSKPLLEEPLEVLMLFYRQRPQSHYSKRTGLKATATAFPTGPPDALKLGRAVEDALNGIVWADDRYIIAPRPVKLWGEKPGVQVIVRAATRVIRYGLF